MARLLESISSQRVNQLDRGFFRSILWLWHSVAACSRRFLNLDVAQMFVAAIAIGWILRLLAHVEICFFWLVDGERKGLHSGAPMRTVTEWLRPRASTCAPVVLALFKLDLDRLLGSDLGSWHAFSSVQIT